jgi:hypothetical protein
MLLDPDLDPRQQDECGSSWIWIRIHNTAYYGASSPAWIAFGEDGVIAGLWGAGGVRAEAQPPVELQPRLVHPQHGEHQFAQAVQLNELLQHLNYLPGKTKESVRDEIKKGQDSTGTLVNVYGRAKTFQYALSLSLNF